MMKNIKLKMKLVKQILKEDNTSILEEISNNLEINNTPPESRFTPSLEMFEKVASDMVAGGLISRKEAEDVVKGLKEDYNL